MRRDEHLLICLMEECAEVQQGVAKSLRFGLDDHHPNRPDVTNEKEILTEFYQLVTVMEILQKEGSIATLTKEEVIKIKERKVKKLNKYMNYSQNKRHLIEEE